MSITVREVVYPSDAELDAYAKVAAEAFGYSFFGSGLQKDKSLQEPILKAHMTAALLENVGEVHLAEIADQGVVGVAVWFKPGYVFLESEEQRNVGWNQVMEKLSPQLQEWWTEFLQGYEAMAEDALGPGVKRGGYHLQLLGVRPEFHRKGVARALTQYAEAKARAAGVPAVVDTGSTTGVSIYEALGYTLMGSADMHAPPPSEVTFKMYSLIKHVET